MTAPVTIIVGQPPAGSVAMAMPTEGPSQSVTAWVDRARPRTAYVATAEAAYLLSESLASRERGKAAEGAYIRRLSQIDRKAPPPLLLDRLDPLGATMLYGPGGIGKGATASAWATGLWKTGHKVLILDYEDHPEEWARRIYGLGGEAATDNIIHVSPLRQWGGAIWKHAEQVKALAEEEERDYIIIDSVAFAVVGTDVSSPDAPTMYGDAVQRIGLPTLSLGHVNRMHDARYPFGSVFWHNAARVTWSLMPKGEDRLLVARKHNNYPPQSAASMEFTWHNGLLGEVAERKAVWTLLDRIEEVLRVITAATPTTIADKLNENTAAKDEQTSAKSISSVLSRDLKNGLSSRFTVNNDHEWCLRHPDA